MLQIDKPRPRARVVVALPRDLDLAATVKQQLEGHPGVEFVVSEVDHESELVASTKPTIAELRQAVQRAATPARGSQLGDKAVDVEGSCTYARANGAGTVRRVTSRAEQLAARKQQRRAAREASR